jgi:CheY-like chemotaxis protein
MPEIPVKLVQFLIVDDHASLRRIVSQHLKSCGFERFAYAPDGRAALQLLNFTPSEGEAGALVETIPSRLDIAGDPSPESIDFTVAHAYCVITDFGMPKANGLQLLKAIRCGETSIPGNTPVILLTGFSDDYVVSAALRLDVSAFILKPVSRNSLREKVQRVLDVGLSARPVASYAAVEIPDEAGEIIVAAPEAATPATAGEWQNDIRWLALGSVPPGAVLANNLESGRGTVLLRRGTVLSQTILQKLQDVQAMSGLGSKIPIRVAA